MTLEEGIRMAESTAKDIRNFYDFYSKCKNPGEAETEAEQHAKDWEQLTEWLKELRAFREVYPYGVSEYQIEVYNRREVSQTCGTCGRESEA